MIIKRCKKCNRTFGRTFEEGKCPFCKATDIVDKCPQENEIVKKSQVNFMGDRS